MIPVRKLVIVLGLLLATTRADADVIEFDLSAVSVAGYGVANPLGYTAQASFTLDSSAFTNPYRVSTNSDGTESITVLTSALTSFSADLTTPVGDRQFDLSDVRTGCPGTPGTPCWNMFFEKTASGIVFDFAQDGLTKYSPLGGFMNVNYGWSAAFHQDPLAIYYSGTWTEKTDLGAPMSSIGTGLPALAFVGGLIFWGRRRRQHN